jgi:farnesyl diphosphate synthase
MKAQYSILEQKIKATGALIDNKIKALLSSNTLIEQAMCYSALAPGKRIRPFLFLTTINLFGENIDHLTDIAAAIELIHTYSLIHDDLPAMDNSTYRRGKLTCHKKFDEATAILAGDALLTYAFEIISKNKYLLPIVKCELITSLSQAIGYQGMINGQMLDMQAVNEKQDLDTIIQLQQLKTGKLLSFCCQAAAIICNANKEQLLALNTYATKIGLIFQITDDLLDCEGDPNIVGKDLKQDDKKGKVTLITLLGINSSKELAQQLLKEAIASLQIFQDKAEDLKHLAEFIASRKS